MGSAVIFPQTASAPVICKGIGPKPLLCGRGQWDHLFSVAPWEPLDNCHCFTSPSGLQKCHWPFTLLSRFSSVMTIPPSLTQSVHSQSPTIPFREEPDS